MISGGVTHPISSQSSFDKAFTKSMSNYAAANPAADPTTTITANNVIVSDPKVKYCLMNSATAQTVKIGAALNSQPNGTELKFYQLGAGLLTIAADTGVTITSNFTPVKAAAVDTPVVFLKIGPSTWLASGNATS